ncbi:hypothetical protein GCM10010345_84390 [Streptomyces canarius]|uniref:Uncharacterized protein n=1 Tax=Streptomyces canarius TaxID=285453 RepID=A0ABQ3DDB5_9ACTN|nr:hypothetical protein GCM10010345_84390 [Streptomyces canarius]
MSGRDVAEFLDVDVDQLAGVFAFVAADDAARGPVQVGQAGRPVAGWDPVHGRGHQTEQVCDAGRSPPSQDTDLDDPPLGAGREPARAVVQAAGAVGHPRFAQRPVAIGPPLSSGGRDLEAFGGPSQRPAALDHAAGQTQAAGLGQGCVTVSIAWNSGRR